MNTVVSCFYLYLVNIYNQRTFIILSLIRAERGDVMILYYCAFAYFHLYYPFIALWYLVSSYKVKLTLRVLLTLDICESDIYNKHTDSHHLITNDMPSAVNCKVLLYADDTALLVSGKSVLEIETSLASELQSVRNWLLDNKLSLHLGKTESILFGTKRKLQNQTNLNILCAGNPIKSKTQVKYLGVELDQSLSGEIIARKIIGKSNAKLKFLYRQARNLDIVTKKTLVSALIQCHMDYACAAWFSGLSKKYQHRLQTTQNKLIRFILQLPARSHIGCAEFKNSGMLPVQKRVNQLQLNHVFNIVHGDAPNYLKSNFKYIHDQHDFNTRSSTRSFCVPMVKSQHFGKSTFNFTSIEAWNALPSALHTLTDKGNFKKSVRTHYFQQIMVRENDPYIQSSHVNN